MMQTTQMTQTVDWLHQIENIYAKLILDEYDVTAQYCKYDKEDLKHLRRQCFLQLYNESFKNRIPYLSEIFEEVCSYNYSQVLDAFDIEVDNNPEMSALKRLKERRRDEYDMQVDSIVASIYHSLVDEDSMICAVIRMLLDSKLSFYCMDIEDEMAFNGYCASEIFGDGSVVLINDCQNKLLPDYNYVSSMSDCLDLYSPKVQDQLIDRMTVRSIMSTVQPVMIGG